MLTVYGLRSILTAAIGLEAGAYVDALQARRMLPDEAVKVFLPSGTTEPIYAPYTERYAPDTTACIFWLKNRRPDLWLYVQGRQHPVYTLFPYTTLFRSHARSRRLLDEVFAEV